MEDRHNISIEKDVARTPNQPAKSSIRIKRKFNRDESPGVSRNPSQNVSSKKRIIDLEPE
jgi:hypothetical protein